MEPRRFIELVKKVTGNGLNIKTHFDMTERLSMRDTRWLHGVCAQDSNLYVIGGAWK